MGAQQMTSVERTLTVLRGGVPDRVPVALHNFLMVAQASGAQFEEFLRDGDAMAEGHIRTWREFGHDVMLLENGTTAPDQVTESCRHAIDMLAPGGGLILAPGCALPPATPPCNVLAMVEAARRYD